jgi:50S ribosomal subunit-associated GTPase HflX
MEEKIQVVNKILHSIGANQKQIMVFNKIDKIPTDQVSKLQEQYKNESTARISVHEQLGIEALKDIIIQQLSL